MSVLPRRLCSGQTVTIHIRVAPSTELFPCVRLVIRDPLDRVVLEHERLLAAMVPPLPLEQPFEQRLADGVCAASPLLLVAHYLREEDDRRAELVGLLHDIGRSIHWYVQWAVPEGAALGRYLVDLSTWSEGAQSQSATAAEDQFFVERLSLAACCSSGAGLVATVRNLSPQPVAARLHEYTRRDGTIATRVRALHLPASAETDIVVESERAALAYAEDGDVLWLGRTDEPTYLRNPTCAWSTGRGDTVVLTARLTGKCYTLTAGGRAVWLAADGLTGESELRRLGSSAFDALVAAGLLKSPGNSSTAG